MRRNIGGLMVAVLLAGGVLGLTAERVSAGPQDCNPNATTVPGHCSEDILNTPVVGHYTSLYAYDANGDWYWDLGDGRVYGTVGSPADLDHATLTTCDYQVNYRGNFGGDPFMNDGWIENWINCSGYDDNGTYGYLIVHQTDPRYRGNPDWAIWGTWEYHALTISGAGNLVRPIVPTP